jgi:hypothetical protein
MGGLGILALTLIGVACWNWRGEYKGRVFWQKRTTAVWDSLGGIITVKDSQIRKLEKQAETSTAYAYQYKQERDKAIQEQDKAQAGMSYSEKLVAYYKRLVSNNTLPVAVSQEPGVKLTDEAVLDAGLKTANREAIVSERADSLEKSIGTRDGLILALKRDRERIKTKVQGIRTFSQNKAAKGGIWPFNQKRKKQLREVDAKAAEVLTESDLEVELNRP